MKRRTVPKTHHTYTNVVLTLMGILFAAMLATFEPFHAFLIHLGGYGYASAFLAGILFVSTFTFATGAIILLILAESLHPIELGLIAGLGSLFGDLTIFRFVRDGLSNEVLDMYNRFGGRRISKIIHAKAYRWLLPVIGAVIIASPMPDELGIALLGLSKITPWKFAVIVYILDSIGIFLVLSASTFIHP